MTVDCIIVTIYQKKLVLAMTLEACQVEFQQYNTIAFTEDR